jgi:phosphatidylcholine synthase
VHLTETDCSPRRAWAVHVFTATGIIAGFMGLLSVLDGSPRAALTWMMVAMVIDGLDGPIARHYDIGRVLPRIDGNALDLMIDYVCCVIAPALFMYRFGLFPTTDNVALICVAAILVSSLYLMANTDIQTPDHYFNGFPAMWNLVATVMFVLQSRPWVNVIAVAVLVVVTFVPVKFVHPLRVRDFRRVTVPVLAVWLAALMYVTWILDDRTKGCAEHCLPASAEIAQGVVYLGMFWLLGVGIARTLHGPFASEANTPPRVIRSA